MYVEGEGRTYEDALADAKQRYSDILLVGATSGLLGFIFAPLIGFATFIVYVALKSIINPIPCLIFILISFVPIIIISNIIIYSENNSYAYLFFISLAIMFIYLYFISNVGNNSNYIISKIEYYESLIIYKIISVSEIFGRVFHILLYIITLYLAWLIAGHFTILVYDALGLECQPISSGLPFAMGLPWPYQVPPVLLAVPSVAYRYFRRPFLQDLTLFGSLRR